MSGLTQAQPPTQAESERRAAAVETARAGNYDAALQTLAELRAAHPDDPELLYDEIAVLGWTERDEPVRTRATGLHHGSTPLFVQLTVAKSLRNLGDFDAVAEARSASWCAGRRARR